MSVVVVGAGLAGLHAARRLQDYDQDVVVLEARDCIGGRTRTLRDVLLHGEPADLGASLIDLGQDMVLEVCDRFGVALTPRRSMFPSDPDGRYTIASTLRSRVIMGGRLLSDDEVTTLADEVRAGVDAYPPSPTETIAAWAARADLGEEARVAVLIQSGLDPIYVPWRVQMAVVHPPLTGQITWMLADGTDSIAHALAEGLDIRLERPVRMIARSGSRWVVEADGEDLTADDVVVAVPLTPTLEIGFDPPLPGWKVDALLSIPMSRGGKVVGQYSHASSVISGIGGSLVSDGRISWCWTRPQGPEDTVVVFGLAGEGNDSFLRDEERALAELDGIVRLAAGDAPRRLAGVVRDWTTEEFSGGVVSVPWADRERLTSMAAQSVGSIHFAGEHTDNLMHCAMDGALRSGLRVADEILSRRGEYVG